MVDPSSNFTLTHTKLLLQPFLGEGLGYRFKLNSLNRQLCQHNFSPPAGTRTLRFAFCTTLQPSSTRSCTTKTERMIDDSQVQIDRQRNGIHQVEEHSHRRLLHLASRRRNILSQRGTTRLANQIPAFATTFKNI